MNIDDLKKEVDFDEFDYDTPLDDYVPPVPHYDDTFEKNQKGFELAYGVNRITSVPNRDSDYYKKVEGKLTKIFAIFLAVIIVVVALAYWLYMTI